MHLSSNPWNSEIFSLGDTKVTPSTLAAALAVFVGSYLLSQLVQVAIRRGLRARGIRAEGSVGALSRLLHYLVVLIGAAVALQTAGVQLGALFAAGAVFAVGIGFAMQNIAQNFVSGVILLVERSIKPGDVIEVGGQMVKVADMGIRSTVVRTLDGDELIVPNSNLVSVTVKNFTLADSFCRVRVKVGIAPGADLGEVAQLLEQVARAADWRDRDFEPEVSMVEMSATGVEFEVSAFTQDPWNQKTHLARFKVDLWQVLRGRGLSGAPREAGGIEPAPELLAFIR
jgi:potassium-dependent mechanosensitive channel